MSTTRYSLIVPVYRNEESIADLVDAAERLDAELDGRMEAVFVVDGSPDLSAELLDARLSTSGLRSRLILLSRNFGSIAAVRAGLESASGPYFAVMAADLQEPPELIVQFFRTLEDEPVDVVVGVRQARADPWSSRLAATLFWAVYRRWVQRDMPKGGVDVFGCNALFRDRLLALREANSSLVGLLIWLGFRRREVPYTRQPRKHGRSAWSFRRRLRYLGDSIFSFSDLPVHVLVFAGILGVVLSVAFSVVILAAKLSGSIDVPGYAATVLLISFFAALNSLGLGIIGSYVWRAYENTKSRPESVVLATREYEAAARAPVAPSSYPEQLP
jgi:glycosyltransferase involved in cell wall biosynthesis